MCLYERYKYVAINFIFLIRGCAACDAKRAKTVYGLVRNMSESVCVFWRVEKRREEMRGGRIGYERKALRDINSMHRHECGFPAWKRERERQR